MRAAVYGRIPSTVNMERYGASIASLRLPFPAAPFQRAFGQRRGSPF